MLKLSRDTKLIGVSVLTAISSIHPVSLTGALGLILRDELDIADELFGFVVGCFFIGSTLGSLFAPKIAERIGPRKSISIALSLTLLVDAGIFFGGINGTTIAAALFFGGLSNSANQPAVNKLLADNIAQSKLGRAISFKQSGIPAASMLGGLSIPAIALTIGWQWAYALGASLTLFTIFAVRKIAPGQPRSSGNTRVGELSTSIPTLTLLAIAGFFATSSVGATTTWITSSAEVAGLSKSAAGILLGVASLLAIALRLGSGFAVDKVSKMKPAATAAGLLFGGAVGAILLSRGTEITHIAGALFIIGLGWSWPALYNYAVLRANPMAPAKATGVVNLGIFTGVFVGPSIMGLTVAAYGFNTAWLFPGSAMTIGAVLMILGSRRIEKEFLAEAT